MGETVVESDTGKVAGKGAGKNIKRLVKILIICLVVWAIWSWVPVTERILNGQAIDVCGIDDPAGLGGQMWREQLEHAYAQTDESHLRILLTHRPEKVDTYAEYDFDLILAGHAHAGQFRIPWINRGILAPDQGFMAKYVNGVYELSNGSIMEVSRGLARESTPLPRFFNHPEIVALEVH